MGHREERKAVCPTTCPFPPVSGDALQLMAEFLKIFVVGEPRAPTAPENGDFLFYSSVDKLRVFSQLWPTLSPVPHTY